MEKQTGPERQAELLRIVKEWQAIEDKGIAQCGKIMGKTENSLIRAVAEIIRQDSVTHKKIQQLIIDSFEKEAIHLTPEELGDIWELIEEHAALEKKSIELAEQALERCRLFTTKHLLTYLIDDEKKHDRLMTQLNDFKRGMYPYASG